MTSLNDPYNSSLNTTTTNGADHHQQQQQQQNIDNQSSSMASPSSQSSPMPATTNTSQQQTQPNTSSTSSTSIVSNTRPNNADSQPILTKPRLQELVREVDPTEQLDEEVEELLLQLADDFVEEAVKSACSIAKHRKVSKIEVKDVQLHLERKWNMWIPGFGTDELRPYKRATVTEAHKQRLALIRKTIKKY